MQQSGFSGKKVEELLNQHGLLKSCRYSVEKYDYLSCNSKDIQDNTLFVCKGYNFKKEYLEAACQSGAVGYVAENDYQIGKDTFIVNDSRKALAVLAAAAYENPVRDMHVVGITGTKGKTTTTFYLKQILDSWQKAPTGVLSTIETFTGGETRDSHLTTPESMELHADFRDCLNHNIHYLTMEVSSQANKLSRCYGIRFDIGMFLNFSMDHIGGNEHTDVEDYFECKQILMDNCKIAIIYSGTDRFNQVMERAKESAEKVVTFGTRREDDFYISNIAKTEKGFTFDIIHNKNTLSYEISMEGRFNVINATGAIAAATMLGVPYENIHEGILRTTVRGRMNVFHKGNKMVVIDYVHNYLSFSELFKSLKTDYPERKIVVVTGCPGDHAFNRRKEIGTLCGQYADFIYLTEEDPQFSDVREICNEMASYIEPYSKPYEIIEDRIQCVEKAMIDMKPNEILILAAKGEETYQKRKGQYVETESDLSIATRMIERI